MNVYQAIHTHEQRQARLEDGDGSQKQVGQGHAWLHCNVVAVMSNGDDADDANVQVGRYHRITACHDLTIPRLRAGNASTS